MQRVETLMVNISLWVTVILGSFIVGFGYSYQSNFLFKYYNFLYKCFAVIGEIAHYATLEVKKTLLYYLYNLNINVFVLDDISGFLFLCLLYAITAYIFVSFLLRVRR